MLGSAISAHRTRPRLVGQPSRRRTSRLHCVVHPRTASRLTAPDPMRHGDLRRQRKTALYVAGIWLCVSAGISGIFVRSEVSRIKEEFSLQSEATYEIVRQRLDENDAVLAGIDSLLQSFPEADPRGLREYSHEMLARYPHIYMVELQPRVEAAQLDRFESWAKASIDPHFVVKDFGYGGERAWHAAKGRQVYYPITFMEPPAKAAHPVLGLDVYADSKFKAAIDQTIASGRPSVSAPFDLFEGGRAYLIFKAIYTRASAKAPGDISEQPANMPGVTGIATRVVSLLIYAGKFLGPGELAPATASLRIYLQGYRHDDPLAVIEQSSARPKAAWERTVFPELVFSRTLPNASQPFVFETRRQVGIEVVRPLPTGLTLIGTFLILMLACTAYGDKIAARAAVRDAKRRLFGEKERALVTLQAIADAVITLDSDGHVQFVNPVAEKMFGIEHYQAVGKSVEDVVGIEFHLAHEASQNPFRKALANRAMVTLSDNSFVMSQDGEKMLIEGSISPVFDQEGVLTGVVGAMRDMGPVRKKAIEALHASEQRLQERQDELTHVARLHSMGEMASGIAHELNQPLSAILSYNQACVRLLHEEYPDFPAIADAMRATTEQAKRAGDIIGRLRAFISKRPANIVSLDLRQAVANALELSEPWLGQSHAQVIIDSTPDELIVRADGVQIEQIVLNLIRNAVEATEHLPVNQRKIFLRLHVVDRSAVLAVRDSGPGITPQARAKLFLPFYTTKVSGMGLGLSICQSIAESYGGNIVESSGDTPGADFRLILPLQEENGAAYANH